MEKVRKGNLGLPYPRVLSARAIKGLSKYYLKDFSVLEESEAVGLVLMSLPSELVEDKRCGIGKFTLREIRRWVRDYARRAGVTLSAAWAKLPGGYRGQAVNISQRRLHIILRSTETKRRLLRVAGAIKAQTDEYISLSKVATSAMEIGLDALERELAASGGSEADNLD